MLLATAHLPAQVVLDGSLGAGGPLSGPTYTIPDSRGRTVGNNLFHSFSRLDLSVGEVANFTGAANIQNVLARVTGGSASSIDGTLQCSISGANFFLINPFGLLFGPNAKVDVSGSFVATSADYVKLADGGRFDARNSANDLLTTAPVSAFGFLGPTAGPVHFEGPPYAGPMEASETTVLAELAVGRSLLVVGGDVRMQNMQISAPSGRIALVGVGSAGEVLADVNDVGSPLGTASFLRLGSVELAQGTLLVTGGDPAGGIEIQGENVTVDTSYMVASNWGVQDAFGMTFAARDHLVFRSAYILSEAHDAGRAGNLTLRAPSILLVGDPWEGNGATGINTMTGGSGAAGDILIAASDLTMRNGTTVSTTTAGPGSSGNIQIEADRVLMQGQQSQAMISATSFDGPAGEISVHADTVRLESDAVILAESCGSNPAGAVRIRAGEFVIDDAGGAADLFTGISTTASTFGLGAGSVAGDIDVQATRVSVRNGGGIKATSDTDQPGGSIQITASQAIEIRDGGFVSTAAGGDGGNIKLTSPGLIYLRGGNINAESGSGDGGNIGIDPLFVVLSGSTLIASATQGNGGNVDIVTEYFLTMSSTVDVSSAFGLQGQINITAPNTAVTGSAEVLSADLLDADLHLQPHCSQRLAGGASTFVVRRRDARR